MPISLAQISDLLRPITNAQAAKGPPEPEEKAPESEPSTPPGEKARE